MRKRIFWTDGTEIKSPKILDLFSRGLITRRYITDRGQPRWYAKCPEPGCTRDYSVWVSKIGKCPWHSKKHSVGGRTSRTSIPSDVQHELFWKTYEDPQGEVVERLWLKCYQVGCQNDVLWKKCKKRSALLCHIHAQIMRRKRPYELVYNALKYSVEMRNKKRSSPLLFTLTYEQFASLCEASPNCHYCGETIARFAHSDRAKNEVYRGIAGIDRKNDDIGYDFENLVTCCGTCNRTKAGYLEFEEMQVIGLLRSGNISAAHSLIEEKKEAWMIYGIASKNRWKAHTRRLHKTRSVKALARRKTKL